ncbi:MAG: Cof-type HAD-IIB family hydrolase [Clostridiales bacterium]|nr:Cof-type HAD-IIB family hydrolase [Clostridiales bacterium]
MAYQLIAVDMDGTLLNSKKEITPRTEAAVTAALARGYHVVMTTGRGYRQIVPYMAQFPAMRYAITSSGAAVADCAQDRIISAQNLPDDAAAELVRAFEGLDGFPIIFSNGEALYRPELLNDPQHFGMDAYVENFKSHCTAVPDMEQRFLAAPYPVEKLDFYFVDSAERAKYLARVQDVRAWVVPCESAGVEINAVGVDKGSGLQALCRCLNIPISAAIAIGDSENDRPLLRDAGLPLAMGNAIADVKAAAQYVMPDCDHDGVAEAVERFLLAQS